MEKLNKRGEVKTEWDMNKRYKESSIKCEFCQEMFNTWKTYHNHAKLAHPEDIKTKWMACSHCDNFLPSKLAMTTHMAKLHSNANLRDASGRFPCDYCTKSYINMLDYNKHCHKDHLERIKRDWLPCPECDSCFRNEAGLDQHARHRHNKQPKKKKRIYQCSYCPKIFTTPEPMYAHANRYHLEEVERDWHFDPVPKLYFPKPPEERRRTTDSSIPRIYCEFCSANVTYIYVSHANKLHYDIISKVWIGCEECDQFFPNQNSLNGHRRCKHPKREEDGTAVAKKQAGIKKSFSCEFCPQSFCKAKILYAHAARDHMESVSKLWHYCQECQLYFPTAASLGYHIGSKHKISSPRKSEKSLNCEFCSEVFIKPSAYTLHVNSVHQDMAKDIWLSCLTCNYLLSNKAALVAHQSRHKEKIAENVDCEFCHLNFQKFSRYAVHANKLHPEEVAKSWKFCSSCNLHYPEDQHTVHFKFGRGQTEKVCKFCDMTYSQLSSFVYHCNAVHTDEIEAKWFHCKDCSKYFPSKLSLENHSKQNHKRRTSKRKTKSTSNPRKRRKIDPEEEGSDDNDVITDDLREDEDNSNIITTRQRSRRGQKKTYREVEEDEVHEADDDDLEDVQLQMEINENEEEIGEGLDWDEPQVKMESELLFKEEHRPEEDEKELIPLALFRKKKGSRKSGKQSQVKEAEIEEGNENASLHLRHVSGDDDETIADEDYFENDGTDLYFDDEEINDESREPEQGNDHVKGDDETVQLSEKSNVTVIGPVTEIPDVWRPPPKARRRVPRVAPNPVGVPDSDISSNILQKFDVDKVPLEPDDFETVKINQSPVKVARELTSSGKGGSYGVPNYLKDCIKLVSSVDRNGVETKRVQCEYCPKSHINTSVYFIHVNKDHLEFAMLYWQQCDSCEKYLPNEKTLSKHKLISHQEGWGPRKFLCEFCSSAHTHSGSYYKHMMSKHLDEISKIWIKCKICDTYLPTQPAMDGHVGNLHPSYHKKVMTMKHELGGGRRRRHNIEGYCDFCKVRYTSRTTLINHVHEKHPEEISREQTSVSCAFCSTSFESNESYFSHVASEHQDEARDKHWVACHFCSSYVPSETRYVIHRANVHPSDSRNAIFRSSDHTKLADYKQRQKQEGEGGDVRLPCHYCLESFTAQGSLNTHMNVKHRAELIQANWDCCPGCKVLVKPNHLKFHIHSCRILNRHSRNDTIECAFCQLCFRTKVKYLNHAHLKHKDELEDAKWISCPKCERFYPDENTFSVHAYVCGDNGPTEKSDKNKEGLKCPHCPLTLVSKSNLSAHLTHKHREKLNINWIACSNCKRTFKGEGGLISHQKVCLHPKRNKISDSIEWSQYRGPSDRQTKCAFCAQTFLYNAKYYKHANLKHTKEIKQHWVQCPDCPLLFPNLTTMRHHLSRTMGKPVYKEDAKNPCDFCDYNCHKRWPLIKHANLKHLDEVKEANWFFCDKCEFYVHSEKYMQRHPCPASKS